MKAHQQRVIDEASALSEKIIRLTAFIETLEFKGIDENEQLRLTRQRAAMQSYMDILDERIAVFTVPVERVPGFQGKESAGGDEDFK